LGEREIQDAERVREEHAIEHLEPSTAANGEHRGYEIAEAVHREAGGLLEGRAVEGGGHVREVGLDRLHVRHGTSNSRAQALTERGDLAEVGYARERALPASRIAQGESGLAPEVGTRQARHSNAVETAQVGKAHRT